MYLNLSPQLAANYKSYSQKVRVLSESWVLNEIYCPNCGNGINDYQNNKPVADFYCQLCSEDFELKSKKEKIGKKVAAGAYSQMLERISSPQKPNFFFMSYTTERWRVNDFFVVPKYYFKSEIVEKRNPLAESAKRAGWVGSNILFSSIPDAGQIYYIKNGEELSKPDVMAKWQKTVFLKELKEDNAKGWILDIMKCIDSLGSKYFTLQDMYTFEKHLSGVHPENNNIKPKIRQQLQYLRDKGYLEFIEAGKYKLN